MTLLRKRGATYDDLVEIPEHFVGEIIGGDLFATPRPRFGHALVHTGLGATLWDAFARGRSGTDGWCIVIEPELHFGAEVVVPDVAGWRRSSLPVIPDDAPFVTTAPDWICEILSPSTADHDRTLKLPLYAREAVDFAWLIDPAARSLEVLRRDGAAWISDATNNGDAVVRAAPFEERAIALAEWWPAG